jgi:acetylornithine deacetylase/succinyl-diaminopimelate desuccinylase-like protein
VCAFLVAIKALQESRGGHARCLCLIETCEESGSPDLPAYLDALAARLGTPSLVVALDAAAGDYSHFWATMSLRAVVDCTLRVEVLALPHHCGMASGIVPSSFRIIRSLLSRIEDERTGDILPSFLHVPAPPERLAQLADAAAVLEDGVCAPFAFVEGAGPVARSPFELLVNNTWRPTMAVLAQDGLPPLASKAHLLRTQTALELSFRFPPGVDVDGAKAKLTALLCEHPPYGARVTIDWTSSCNGWNAPPAAPWLAGAIDEAARTHFGTPPRFFGCGGAIPFVDTLGRRYPGAQYVITGVLGPGSNAHGPDEFLHLPTATRLTSCIAEILNAHSARHG